MSAEFLLLHAEHSSLMPREAADAISTCDDGGGKCHCFLLQPSIWPSEISGRKGF